MRAAVNTPAGSAGARVARFPAGVSLPRYSAGRPPRCPFRGLLDVLWPVPRYALHEPYPFVEPRPSRVSAAHNGY